MSPVYHQHFCLHVCQAGVPGTNGRCTADPPKFALCRLSLLHVQPLSLRKGPRMIFETPCFSIVAGMGSSLGSYQQAGNTGYSTFSVQGPIVSQPTPAAAPTLAPTRLQACPYHHCCSACNCCHYHYGQKAVQNMQSSCCAGQQR